MKIKIFLCCELSICLAVLLIFSGGFTTSEEEKDEVFMPYALGALFDEEYDNNITTDIDEYNSIRNNIYTRDLQSSVDLSNNPLFPPIGNQGWVGSCCSWASTYYQFGFQVANMSCNLDWLNIMDNSKRFSPKFVYNQVNDGENNGSSFRKNYNVLKKRGAVRFSEFEPLESSGNIEYLEWCTNKEALEKAMEFKVSDWQIRNIAYPNTNSPITSNNCNTLYNMKSLLSNGHVLTFMTKYGEYERIYDNNYAYYFPNGNYSKKIGLIKRYQMVKRFASSVEIDQKAITLCR